MQDFQPIFSRISVSVTNSAVLFWNRFLPTWTEPLRLQNLPKHLTLIIIPYVARGWESKSVEDQQAQASAAKHSKKERLTPQQQEREHQRQSLLLSRQRIIQQLQAAVHPNHQATLKAALAELDSQLARLG